MRPWMAPLSMTGTNHCTTLLYDARKHCIGIFDQWNLGRGDRNLREGWITVGENDEADEATTT